MQESRRRESPGDAEQDPATSALAAILAATSDHAPIHGRRIGLFVEGT